VVRGAAVVDNARRAPPRNPRRDTPEASLRRRQAEVHCQPAGAEAGLSTPTRVAELLQMMWPAQTQFPRKMSLSRMFFSCAMSLALGLTGQ
jgi:hypothetical protein